VTSIEIKLPRISIPLAILGEFDEAERNVVGTLAEVLFKHS
jgi:hypothetical protein